MTEYDDVRPGAAERLSRMLHIATVEAHGDAPFEEFVALLAELYPRVHAELTLEKPTDRSLLFSWAGEGHDRPLVIMAHYDVVPVNDDEPWQHPAFSGEIVGDEVWGRGALDDKGALLVALEAVENLLSAGFTPTNDIYIALGGNEESYGSGALATATLFADRGIVPWLVLDEGGAVVDAPLSFVPVRAAMVGVAEKGVVTIDLSVLGTGGHASAPPNDIATTVLARAISRIQRSPFRSRMPRAFRQMLAGFAPHVAPQYRVLLWLLRSAPWLSAPLLASRGGETAALMRTSVAVTMLSAGTAANVLPSSARATLNVRVSPHDSVAHVVARLTKVINDPRVVLTVPEANEPTRVTDDRGDQFAAVRAAIDASYPGVVTAPYIMMAATDSRHFASFAEATLRFAPLAMTRAQRDSIHGVDEHVTIDSLDRGTAFYHHLITSYR
jgi:carboxypeptidase PM20D1